VNGEVIIKWQTATETNNSGFAVERSQEFVVSSQKNWENIKFVEGNGTTTEVTEYTYRDKIEKPGTYYYRLKQIDFDGTTTFSSEIKVDVNGPVEIALMQNYPNPFNPSTTISFNLSKSGVVTLKVYNLMGEEIITLVDGYRKSGIYTVNFNAEGLPSGMYIYQLNTSEKTQVRKMILMK
jgi:hypothetical protein